MTDYNRKIQDLQKEIDRLRLEKEQEELEAKTKRQIGLRPLAITAHSLLCCYNHTDGCSWGYEEGENVDWNYGEHARWLDKIEKILQDNKAFGPVMTKDRMSEILVSFEKIKSKYPDTIMLLDKLRRGY